MQPAGGGNLIKRIFAGLAAFLAVLILAPSAWGSFMQDQPLGSGWCGECASSNGINWVMGARTTCKQIYRKFMWYHDPNGASYHTGRRDLVLAVGKKYHLHTMRYEGGRLRHGFAAAKRALENGGAVIMLAKVGKLTHGGHYVMGYLYRRDGDKIAISDSNRKNPDRWRSVSWLLDPSKGHVVIVYTYTFPRR